MVTKKTCGIIEICQLLSSISIRDTCQVLLISKFDQLQFRHSLKKHYCDWWLVQKFSSTILLMVVRGITSRYCNLYTLIFILLEIFHWLLRLISFFSLFTSKFQFSCKYSVPTKTIKKSIKLIKSQTREWIQQTKADYYHQLAAKLKGELSIHTIIPNTPIKPPS